MQSDPKEIYLLTSKRTSKPFELYKEIGGFVFASLHDNLRRPTSLITRLRGIGFFYLRRKRMEIVLKMFPPDFDKTLEDFDSHLDLLRYENKREIYEIFQERMKEYDEYLKLRNEIREERWKTQILLTPKNDES